MAWPFSHAPAPTYDTGFVAVPDTPTTQTSSSVYVMGIHLNNPTVTALTFSLMDNTDKKVITELQLPPKSIAPFAFEFMPMAGVKWSASGVGIIAKIWGY